MLFTRLFCQKSTNKTKKSVSGVEDAKTQESTTESSVSSTSSSGNKTMSRRRKASSTSKAASRKRTNIEAAKMLLDAHNDKDAKGLIESFATPDSVFGFEDNDIPDIKACDLVGHVKYLHRCFPDLKFNYDRIVEETPGEVTIEGLQFSGTHTGEPYSLLPGVFPAIPAAGKFCMNDEENLVCEVKDGKILRVQIVALGPLTGPPGAYFQLGGSLTPPSSD